MYAIKIPYASTQTAALQHIGFHQCWSPDIRIIRNPDIFGPFDRYSKNDEQHNDENDENYDYITDRSFEASRLL